MKSKLIVSALVIGMAWAVAWTMPRASTSTVAFDRIHTDSVKTFNVEPFTGCVHLSYVTEPPVSGIDTMLLAAQRREPPPDAQRREGPWNWLLRQLGLAQAKPVRTNPFVLTAAQCARQDARLIEARISGNRYLD